MGKISSNNSLIIFITISLLTACKEEWPSIITTTSVKEITSTSAISGGCIISEGQGPVSASGICWGKKSNPTIEDCDSVVYNNSGDNCFECIISGLIPGTLFHVRAFAINSTGTFYGENMLFSTMDKTLPICYTLGASRDSSDKPDIVSPASILNPIQIYISLERDSPVFCGLVLANNFPTSILFEYGPTTSYGSILETRPSTISGNQLTYITSKGLQIGEFSIGQEFHFRIKAENKNGITYGEDMVVIIYPDWRYRTRYEVSCAKNPTENGATLNGVYYGDSDYAHPLAPVSVEFEYGATKAYGQSLPADQSPITGKFPVCVSATISGLAPSTVYHYRIKTSSAWYTFYSEDATFMTENNSPVCRTLQPYVSWSEIILRAQVIANDVPSYVVFEYGTTTEYGQYLNAEQSPIISNSADEITATYKINSDMFKTLGLHVNCDYHFRVKVTNRYAAVYGNDLVFRIPFYDGPWKK